MGRSTLCAIVMAFLLSGCGWSTPDAKPARMLSEEQIIQLRAEVKDIGDRCRSGRLSNRPAGFVASVQCSNPGILAAYQKVEFPYMGLLNLALAKRLQLAERADEKKISEGDMLVEFFSDVSGLPVMPAP